MYVLCIKHKHPPRGQRKMVIVTAMLYLSGSDSYFTYNKGKDTTENHKSKKAGIYRCKCHRLLTLLEHGY